ncbi:MAG: hypothetical protein ABGZ17_26125, partial [Planctomycetaceae bacterium]
MKNTPRAFQIVLTTLSCLFVCGWRAEPAESQDNGRKPNRVVYDFKTVPQLPEIEAPTQQRIRDAIQRGIDFLLSNQNSNGSWGSATRTKGLNIYAPVPGAHHAFRAAVTSLCISALLEVAADDAKAMAAVARGEVWLYEHLPRLRRATSDALYNVWGHAYSIQALVRLYEQHSKDPDRRRKITALIREQFDMLTRYESVDGGWGYYDFRAGAQKP